MGLGEKTVSLVWDVGAYTSATVLGILSCGCISISNTIAVQSRRFSAAAYSTRGINGEQVPCAVDTIAVVYGRRASGPAAVVLRLSTRSVYSCLQVTFAY